jgi:addiction module HigA family antidote
MVRIPTNRVPTHPGEMLLEEFLVPADLTQRQLANSIHVPYQRVNDIVNGRRGITPSTALRLAKFFGNSPDFWMNLQLRLDLYHARNEESKVLTKIKPYQPGAAIRA